MTTQTKSVDTERIEEGFRLLGLGTEADRQRLRSLADLVRPNEDEPTYTFIRSTSGTNETGEDTDAELEGTSG